MPETIHDTSAATATDASACAAHMAHQVALMAGRLAGLIERAAPPQGGPLVQGLGFLSAMREAARSHPPDPTGMLPLQRLAEQLTLTPEEIDLIVLAAMADEHEGYASVLRTLNPRGEPQATAGLAAQIWCDGLDRRALLRQTLCTGAAVRHGMLRLISDAPFFERTLTLAEGLWPVLCGIDVYPTSLSGRVVRAVTTGLEVWLESAEATRAIRVLRFADPHVILVVGESETIARHRAVALAAAAGRHAAVFDIAPTAAPGANRLAQLHTLARGAVPVFEIVAADAAAPAPITRLECIAGPVLVCSRRAAIVDTGGSAPVTVLDIQPLGATARERMWRATLPELADQAETLAVRYAVEPAVAADVVADLRARSAVTHEAIDLPSVADAVRARCALPAGAGLRLVRPTATWSQLVLRPDRRMLLLEALNRLLHQRQVLDTWKFLDGRPGARGVRVLLSGPPGTGKTLSAEVMAESLGVDLLTVDISRLVSKWIGETEKHLAQAFDAAERTQAVLLFDEADALFGKRTDVSDAHDRYANLETAYLLSRLERFEGLVILSTNLKHNIDPAFLRRLEFVVELDEPGVAEREALWRCHLPAHAPVASDVSVQELAELYPIVGGLIRNASVAAGFLAAAAGTAIGRQHLVGAVRREYDKSAKAFPGAPAGVSLV
ncbi:MAG: ATP-binding protein [Acidobacteriota bacterium]